MVLDVSTQCMDRHVCGSRPMEIRSMLKRRRGEVDLAHVLHTVGIHCDVRANVLSGDAMMYHRMSTHKDDEV